jgi:hypothetical protein
MFANYKYSLTGEQQQDIQIFLRSLPPKAQNTNAWRILHDLTCTDSWTEAPQNKTIKQTRQDEVAAEQRLQPHLIQNSI